MFNDCYILQQKSESFRHQGLGKNAFPHYFISHAKRRKGKTLGKLTTEPFFATLRLCEIFGVIRFF